MVIAKPAPLAVKVRMSPMVNVSIRPPLATSALVVITHRTMALPLAPHALLVTGACRAPLNAMTVFLAKSLSPPLLMVNAIPLLLAVTAPLVTTQLTSLCHASPATLALTPAPPWRLPAPTAVPVKPQVVLEQDWVSHNSLLAPIVPKAPTRLVLELPPAPLAELVRRV
jgi:hypothetical protein